MYKIAILLIAFYTCSAIEFPLSACGCDRDYHPVCASDGQTYPNSCEFECALQSNPGLKITLCKNPVCRCRIEYVPVCGSDGISYHNDCVLGCEIAKKPSLDKSHDGQCK